MYPEQTHAEKKQEEEIVQIVPVGNDSSLEVFNEESEASSDFISSREEED